MSSLWILHRPHSLDTSSPSFLRHLHHLIQYDEEDQHLTSLPSPQAVRLVDFLDEALSTVSVNGDIYRQCLHKLQAICARRTILPSSYTISGKILIVGDSPIARGPIADVWEGIHNGKKITCKYWRDPLKDDQMKSFIKEAITRKRLRHPNIVPFIGVVESPLQIISECMLNGTLTEYLEKYPDTNRTSLLLDVAEGLNYLHVNHTIHGNLEGPNILIDHDGHARLTDFEPVLIVRGMNSVIQENGCTAAWTAPEILKGAGAMTREADIFAFGMVVIEVFTGRRPFSKFTTPVITSKIIGGERPARPQRVQALGLTDSVWEVTVRCWHQDPTQRPAVTEVARVVRECYRTVALWTKITDIPVKIFTDNVLSFCEAKDVFSLGCTNKFFALVAANEKFWRQKLAVDYNFTGSETTKMSGWKITYQRFGKPRVFVWGDASHGQLGLSRSQGRHIPFPTELHLPGVCVVSLAMNHMASWILDADGSVYVLGKLSIYGSTKDKNFVENSAIARKPLKLQLPAPTHAISCDDQYGMTLDVNSMIWIFLDWGRPFQLVSPSLDCSSPETTPIQITCTIYYSAILTRSGNVYVWWKNGAIFWNQYHEAIANLDKGGFARVIACDGGTAIPCHTWKMNMDDHMLHILPGLPNLPATGLPGGEYGKETKLIKIAASLDCIIGLTNKGHVLKMSELYKGSSPKVWHYLPNYSEIDKVKKHPAFCATRSRYFWKVPPRVELSSDAMPITHIFGNYAHFFAYSSSILLRGDTRTTPEALPMIIPELQNRSIISIVQNDQCFGAVTSSGKLLTCNKYPKDGALSYYHNQPDIGDPTGGYTADATIISEVRFDHGLEVKGRVERYCFAAAMGGHHSAALVVDLTEDDASLERS